MTKRTYRSESARNAFIDTGSLLHSFAIYLDNGDLANYLTDDDFKYYTFEKCIYEVRMAIRGVGGKKPDEGRGDWAQRHLRGEDKPKQLDYLASKFHNGDMNYAHYWINRIDETSYALDLGTKGAKSSDEWLRLEFESIKDIVSNPDWDDFKKLYDPLFSLLKEKSKFESLLNDFENFIEVSKIAIVSYSEVFNKHYFELAMTAGDIDWFGRNTTIPSEDLEIVMCAVLIETKVFITTDLRLKRCMYSLGDNIYLHANNVIHHNEFSSWKAQYLQLAAK